MKRGACLRYFPIVLLLLLLSTVGNNAWAEEVPPPPAAAAPASPVEQLYQQAVQLHQAGQLDQALAAYTRVIEQDPRHANAYLGRAQIYDAQQQFDLAIADLRQVIALNPENADAYGVLGWILIREGRFDEARTMTQKAHKLDPEAFSWAINLGHLYLLAGDEETARRYYLKGLDSIETEQQFEEGPVADFKLLIEKGWQVEVMQRELVWIQRVYPAKQRWNSLNQEVVTRYQAGDYRTAVAPAREALTVAESTFGAEHPATAQSLNNLAAVLEAQGLYGEAESLLHRAVAIRQKVWGPEHPDTAQSLSNLARVLRARGHDKEAESFYRQALAIYEKVRGPENPDTVQILNNLAVTLQDQGRYREAEPLHSRALAIREKVLGPDHPATAQSLNNLGHVLYLQGRYLEAESLHHRALDICKKALGPEHPDTIQSLNHLARVLRAQGRMGEAERLYRDALDLREKVLGPNHPATAQSLDSLALMLQDQGRYGEAEPLLRRALAIREKMLDPGHPDTAISLNDLAEVLRTQSRYQEAEPLYRRALAINEKVLGPEHPDTAINLNNLAVVLNSQDRPGEAESFLRRALAIKEKVLGAEHPDIATSLNNLAAVLQAQNSYGEAEPLYQRAVTVAQKAEEPNTLLIASRNLGLFLVARGCLQDAVPPYRTAIDTLDRLFAYTQGLPEEARHTFLGQYAYVYREFIDLLLKLHEQDPKAGYDREVLAVASRNQSRIFSELLRQADVRVFSTDPAFVAIQQRWQDLHTQLATLRAKRATIPISEPEAETRKANLTQEIAKADAELNKVTEQLRRDYPRFLELQQPAPVTLEQLQQTLLHPDEALLSFVLLKDRTVLLAVTRERFALRTMAVTEKDMADRVRQIRGPLEQVSKLDKLDPEELYKLYQDLIAPVEDTLRGANRVLVVADGSLYNLPLELLVTAYGEKEQDAFRRFRKNIADGSPEKPYLGEYAKLNYLADRYRFSYLPSLAALVSQRNYPRPPVPMTRDLVAFADPIFSKEDSPGNDSTKGYSAATQTTLQLLTRSGVNSNLSRLPDSAEEARAIADLLGDDKGLYLRDQAQERIVKMLNTQGKFQGLHYLLFSTHGLLGGEFLPPVSPSNPPALARFESSVPVRPKQGEPALVLTLVDPAPEDGFLTMSEVLGLNLNTDLVVLSACNTAGEKANQGEGFVGLTRSFLYAGTRHLLVSHWKVASNAARDLMIATFTRLKQGQPPLEALTESRRQVRGQTWQQAPAVYVSFAHPYFWAPFVVVGD